MADWNLGPYRPNPRGDYDSEINYKFLDIVKYNGNSYINCYLDTIDGVSCIGILPEGQPESEIYWQWIGGRGEKGDLADQYKPYQDVHNGIWDYNESDKIFVPTTAPNKLEIINVYNGCCGIVISKQDLELPEDSLKSIDYDYVHRTIDDDYYFYTFTYTDLGTDFHGFVWHRTVINHGYTE